MEKFPESIWKGSIYTVTWIWAFYIISSGESNYFFDLRSQWTSKCVWGGRGGGEI